MTRRRPPPSPRRPAPQPSSNRTRYIWLVVIFVLLFGGAFVAFDFFSQNQSILPTASASQNVVFEGTVVVEPNRFEAFEFEIDTATMSDVVLTGDFSTTGGSGDDIVALVMDEIDYRNWLSEAVS